MAATKSAKNPTDHNDTPNTPEVREGAIAKMKVDELRRKLRGHGVKGTAELKRPELVKKLIKAEVADTKKSSSAKRSAKNPTSHNDTPNTPGVSESAIAGMKADELRRKLRGHGVKGTAELKKPELVKRLTKVEVSATKATAKKSAKAATTKATAKADSTKATGKTGSTSKASTSKASTNKASAGKASTSKASASQAGNKASTSANTTKASNKASNSKAGNNASNKASTGTNTGKASTTKAATSKSSTSASKATTSAGKASASKVSAGKAGTSKASTSANTRTGSTGKATTAKTAQPSKSPSSKKAKTTDASTLRTGKATSSSVKYSQEITSTEDKPERAGRSLVTTDHEVIRQWAKARKAVPSTVAGTEHDGHLGVLRFDFPGYSGDRLTAVEWDQWLATFDKRRLNFIYQQRQSNGKRSNFFRLENPDE